MSKFKVLSSTVEVRGPSVEGHPALLSQVNDFIADPKYAVRVDNIQWLQSSGLKDGSHLSTTLTAVIEYKDAVDAVKVNDPFATAPTTAAVSGRTK